MGILNSSQIKSLKRMNKYLSEMLEATTDLSNDCTKISTNKPKGSAERKKAQELTADFTEVNFLFEKAKSKINEIITKENENESNN